jgi:hypothetical protein
MMRRILSAALIMAAAAVPAAAEPVRSVSVAYNIDVGPLTMTVVKYVLNLDEAGMHSRAQIRSHGISRIFSEYTATAEADSKAEGSAIAPMNFRLERERDEGKRITTLNWAGNGIDYEPREKKPERRARVESALTADVSDPMTAVLRIGTAGQTPCPSIHRIFDGRDVYDLELTDKGEGRLDDDDGYRGAVRLCKVSWTPIAGRAAEKNEPRDSYDVAFAPAGDLPSGRTLWLPVKMSGKLKGLRFKAYATKFQPVTQAAGAAGSD